MDKPTTVKEDGWQIFRDEQYFNSLHHKNADDALESLKNKMMDSTMSAIRLEMQRQGVDEYVLWVRGFRMIPSLETANDKVELVIEAMAPEGMYG